MEYDPTVVLDKSIADLRRGEEAKATQSKELSGRLTAHGVEFDWRARRLDERWFVSVINGTCGSRSQLTEENPIDFALRLAKEVAGPQL